VHSLKKRYIVKLLSSFVTGITGLVLIAIVPNALGPVAFGQFSFIQQIFSQITTFLDAGTSTAFFTKLSAKVHRVELIKFYGLVSLMILTFLYVGMKAIYFYNLNDTIFPDVPIEYSYYGVLLGFLLWFTQIYIKISDANVLTVSVEIIKIIHKFLSLFLLFFMISFVDFDLSAYFYFNFISLTSFIALITIIFVKKDIITKAVFLTKVKYLELSREFYNYASPLFVFNSVAIIVAIVDIWLLQKVSGSIQTGFYGIAYSIAAMCFLFTGAMTQIIAREFSKSFAENNIDNIKDLFKTYTPILYAIAAYFGVFLSFQSDALLEIFMDKEFEGAYFALMIMAFYPIHQTYGQLNSSLFFSTENTRQYRDTSLFSMFIGMIFSYVFIYELELGAVGFAWKMVLGQLIGVNLQLFFITRFLGVKITPFLKHQIVVLLFFVMAAYLVSWSPLLIGNDLADLVFNGFLYTLLTILGVIFFPSIVGLTRVEISHSISLIKKWRD